MKVTTANLSEFDLYEGENTTKPRQLNNFTDEAASLRLAQYLPHTEIELKETPNILDITKHQTRVYLRSGQLEKLQHQLSFGDNGALEVKDYDAKHFLDLGVAPLQRIVNEMKSLCSDVVDESYNPMAAKAAGLTGYCDYLSGKAT